MKKEFFSTDAPHSTPSGVAWIGVDEIERVRLTSEDPLHSLEEALQGTGQGWLAGKPGVQVISLSFKEPRAISRIYLRFDVREARTQEFSLRWSGDRGVTYQALVRQQFNFSDNSPLEEEDFTLKLTAVTDLELTVIPDISRGPALASLSAWRIR